MKKLLILFFISPICIHSQIISTDCVFYLGAENTIECLGLSDPDYKKFETDNGTVNANLVYRPKKAGTADIKYQGKTYRVNVKELPDPEILFEGHMSDFAIKLTELKNGIRIIPLMGEFPYDVYTTMISAEYSLLNKKKKVLHTYQASDANLIRLSDAALMGAAYLNINYVVIKISGMDEKKVNCNVEYKIER